MDTITFIVQASSRNWSGSKDICMDLLKGHPVVYWVMKRIMDEIPSAKIILAAPLFDKGGALDDIIQELNSPKVAVFYGSDFDPLNRILACTDNLDDDDYIVRIDGIHYFVDLNTSLKMLKQAAVKHLDCVKLPDGWPTYFTSDIYRIGALRKLNSILNAEEEQIYRIHPKYYLFHNKNFRCEYAEELPEYADDYLLECRALFQDTRNEERIEVNEDKYWAGCQLSFHYELAMTYIKDWMKVLDIACGDGYGTRILAQRCREIYGADIDKNIIAYNRENLSDMNIRYDIEDVTNLSYQDNEFDAITSMETLEHVNVQKYFEELYRVLKPGGILIISTPQNLLGRIPITPAHLREYSMDELKNLCGTYFKIEKFIGIKQGRIIFPNDPYGNNSMAICSKR